MNFPPLFLKNLQAIHGEAGKIWLTRLPALIQAAEKEFQFIYQQPVASLNYHFVAHARDQGSGKDLILKMSPKAGAFREEVACLKSFVSGVPRVLAISAEKDFYLMERLDPGVPLISEVDAGDDILATRIIAQLIKKLHGDQHAPATNELKHISALTKKTFLLRGRIDKKLFSQWESMLRDLTKPGEGDLVLHGDLHHGNILLHEGEWKAIDPHGLMGDPVYDTAAMMYNPLGHWENLNPLERTLETRIKIVSEELAMEKQRIKAWAFCKTLLAAAWSVEDHGVLPDDLIALAAIIDNTPIL